MSKLKWTAGFIALWLALVACGNIGLRRTEVYAAEQCVRASDGTDSAVEACYTDRNLELPE